MPALSKDLSIKFHWYKVSTELARLWCKKVDAHQIMNFSLDNDEKVREHFRKYLIDNLGKEDPLPKSTYEGQLRKYWNDFLIHPPYNGYLPEGDIYGNRSLNPNSPVNWRWFFNWYSNMENDNYQLYDNFCPETDEEVKGAIQKLFTQPNLDVFSVDGSFFAMNNQGNIHQYFLKTKYVKNISNRNESTYSNFIFKCIKEIIVHYRECINEKFNTNIGFESYLADHIIIECTNRTKPTRLQPIEIGLQAAIISLLLDIEIPENWVFCGDFHNSKQKYTPIKINNFQNTYPEKIFIVPVIDKLGVSNNVIQIRSTWEMILLLVYQNREYSLDNLFKKNGMTYQDFRIQLVENAYNVYKGIKNSNERTRNKYLKILDKVFEQFRAFYVCIPKNKQFFVGKTQLWLLLDNLIIKVDGQDFKDKNIWKTSLPYYKNYIFLDYKSLSKPIDFKDLKIDDISLCNIESIFGYLDIEGRNWTLEDLSTVSPLGVRVSLGGIYVTYSNEEPTDWNNKPFSIIIGLSTTELSQKNILIKDFLHDFEERYVQKERIYVRNEKFNLQIGNLHINRP